VPSLSEKLKALGVNVGTQDIAPRKAQQYQTIVRVLNGQMYETPIGEAFLIKNEIPIGGDHGSFKLELNSPFQTIAQWAGDQRIANSQAQDFIFIDIETTGLSGGTGTYAFLIGAGKFVEGSFQFIQFFMRDPAEEPAQLFAFEEFIASGSCLVSYNGKAFDVPLLNSRFTANGLKSPLVEYSHIDLLHLARRLWSQRLPRCTLGYVEAHVLATARSEDDVPGWMIPQMYFDYLRSGDAEPLSRVLYHNEMDVLSLALLLNYTASILNDPIGSGTNHVEDLISLAKLFEDMGDIERAIQLYLHGLQHDDFLADDNLELYYIKALHRLSMIYKRQESYSPAIELWERAASHDFIDAHIELAKYYEHRTKKYPIAIQWTEKAISILQGGTTSQIRPQIYIGGLRYRLARLIQKNERSH
jgi:hypothetical protein